MTTLAVRLNELAAANEQGLLNDDEYRLLRQDVFERYANLGGGARGMSSVVLVVPEKQASRINLAQPKPRKLGRRPSEATISTVASAHSEAPLKKSKTNIISSFIRRATSPLRSTSSSPAPSISRSSSYSSSPQTSSKIISEATGLSRSASSRKISEITYPSSYSVSVPNPHLLSPPTSPTRSSHTSRSNTSNYKSSKSLSKSSNANLPGALAAHDIFEDGGLFTPADIRQAILDLDKDAKRVIRAFDELEDSAVRRAQLAAREASTGRTVLPSSAIDSSIHLPLPPIAQRSRSDSASNGPVTRSSSTSNPTLSRAKSTASIRSLASGTHPNPDLIVSPKSPSLRKKGSVSSLASSLFSLKTRPSMPSLPSISSGPSGPVMSRSRSDSAASTLSNAHLYHSKPNPSHGQSSFSGFSVATTGRGIEGRPSMSTISSVGYSGHGRTSTSTGRPSTSTSIASTREGRSDSASGHSPLPPTTSFRVPANSMSHVPSPSHSSKSRSGSVRWRADSIDSMRSERSGSRTPGKSERERARGRSAERDRGGEDSEDGRSVDEIRQIRKRRKDVIGRYETRREYLKARLRGAELHERVLKGR
ncbi:hypothetical protein GYMLUDRAFT_259755 [Collybiopsis luxurians FD-317 M1]|uniref:Uncharacterized protein n=1 Tax=Collybiopsis luxurians FD-317 M1 TaxID=944289 RepID=A0A0D0D1J0_9AGAR|nr:hypothetical protein GYMLUDRAFT_259755 [Collybiopsis luxurians FD-317 M1]